MRREVNGEYIGIGVVQGAAESIRSKGAGFTNVAVFQPGDA